MIEIEKAKKIMHVLHKGIKHESGMMMTDRIQSIVDKIEKFYDGEDKEEIIAAAYLQEAFNKKYIRPELLKKERKFPFTFDAIKHFFGYNVARTVFEFSTEPCEKMMHKGLSSATTMELAKQRVMNCNPSLNQASVSEQELEARAIALWTSDMTHMTHVVSLAKELLNYETEKDRMDMQKPLSWHSDYTQARMHVVEALKDSCPQMYDECVKMKASVLRNIDVLERSIVFERQKLNEGACI